MYLEIPREPVVAEIGAPRGVRWLDRGPREAPVALLLHGLASLSDEMFAGVGRALLDAGLRVIALDRPGYGGSDPLPPGSMSPSGQARWVARALAARDLAADVVVGHSYGGAVALRLAGLLDARLRGLVLVNPFCRPTPPAAAPLMRMSVAPGIGPLVRRRMIPAICRPLARRMLANACAPDPTPAALAELPVATLVQESALQAMAAELTRFNDDVACLPALGGGLGRPVVALTGAQDSVIPARRHGEWLAGFLPRVEHRCVDGGHMLHHARPELVAQGVLQVLGERRDRADAGA